MSKKILAVLFLAAFCSLHPALAQYAQVPDHSVKMVNSASIPLKVSFFHRRGSTIFKQAITIKARRAEIIRDDPYRAEICTKGHGCSSTPLESRGTYAIVRSEKEEKWIIVELFAA